MSFLDRFHDPQTGPHISKTSKSIAIFTILVIGIIFILFPIAWMVTTALKDQNEIYAYQLTFLPQKPTLENFIIGWKEAKFYKFFSNSIIITSFRVAITVLMNAMAGFALGKYKFRGRTFLFYLIIAAMMIPDQVRMIPLYNMIHSLHLIDTYVSVILPSLGATFGTFLMMQYVQGIPDELMESARIDGCTEYRIFAQIVLPLTKPVVVTNLVFQFMWGWNDLLYPLLFIHSKENYTVQLALAAFRDSDTVTVGPIMAMSLLSIIPIVIVFLSVQKYFIEGIAVHGVKG